MKRFRIGLDIDDCLADFWGAYCEYFDTKNNPRMLEDSIITKNVQQVLSKDRDFWLGLKVINMPDSQVSLLRFISICPLLVREGNGTPLQYPCLENPMDGGGWWATVHGVAKSRHD